MNIEAVKGQIRAIWPHYDRPTHDEIIRRLKTISGAEFDKDGACWWVPLAQADRMIELFPKASFDYDVICHAEAAKTGRIQAFFAMLVHFNVKLEINASGAICAVGESVSPLIQELVDERADALRPLILAAKGKPTAQHHLSPEVNRPLTVEDAKLEPLMTGIINARRKAEEDAVKYAKRRKGTTKFIQKGLGI